MSTLKLFKNYNNYYNRVIKHDYSPNTMNSYTTVDLTNINFNPGDGVMTEQVINWNQNWLPDYLMIDPITDTDKGSIVESNNCTLFSITNNGVNVFFADSNILSQITANNFYNTTTKQIDLSTVSNYHNEDYGQTLLTIEGKWSLNEFSLNVDAPNQLNRINIWSDSNNITINSPGNLVINKEYLLSLGWQDNEDVLGISFYAGSPDTFYGWVTCKDYNSQWKPNSSWFVMSAERLRKNQYNLTLKKDNIADHYNVLTRCPAYIEKATIKNFNDPAIFNREDLLVNQIKQSEKLLKDKTNMAWLVAWINSNIEQTDWTNLFNHVSVPYSRNIEQSVAHETADIDTWASNLGLTGTYKCLKEAEDYIEFRCQNEYFDSSARVIWAWVSYKIFRDKNREATGGNGNKRDGYTYNFKDRTPYGTMINQLTNINDSLYYAVKTQEGFITGTDSRFNYINDVIKETKNGVVKYYKVEATYSAWDTSSTYSSSSPAAQLIKNCPDGATASLKVVFNGDYVTFSVRDITNEMATTANIYADVSAVAPKNSGLIDAPYMAICIPYTLNEVPEGSVDNTRQDVLADGTVSINLDSTKAFAAVTLLSHVLGDNSHLYDVQLLPYCPIVNEIEVDGPYRNSYRLVADAIATSRKIKFYQTDGFTFDTTTPLMEAFVFFNSSFTFDINYSISDKTTVLAKKLANETETYRLNSPNYSAFFEFSPYMNNGVTKFNVDCTYKPYKSYIHMNPDFKGLYGLDFNDARGLIITSDFSIPQVTDAWRTYQINNKNYADIFARQQQNLRVQQKWSDAEAGLNMLAAPLTAGVAGGLAGSKAGPYGAIAGAVVGTGLGLAGGIADYTKTKELNKEALAYNRDMYNYNLQNIQAMPQTLSSISSYDANNKLWPFIEFYKCTDVELDAMENKLKYNGMKIGRIDTMQNFISDTPNYIKAKLIRAEESNLDYNELNDIALELDKGVFM